ncbi:MAG: OmpA family protein [Devosia sp.]
MFAKFLVAGAAALLSTVAQGSEVSVWLSGDYFQGGPAFSILLDDKEIGSGLVDPMPATAKGTEFTFTVDDAVLAAAQTFKVRLTNDKNEKGVGDRNLQIVRVMIGDVELKPTDFTIDEQGNIYPIGADGKVVSNNHIAFVRQPATGWLTGVPPVVAAVPSAEPEVSAPVEVAAAQPSAEPEAMSSAEPVATPEPAVPDQPAMAVEPTVPAEPAAEAAPSSEPMATPEPAVPDQPTMSTDQPALLEPPLEGEAMSSAEAAVTPEPVPVEQPAREAPVEPALPAETVVATAPEVAAGPVGPACAMNATVGGYQSGVLNVTNKQRTQLAAILSRATQGGCSVVIKGYSGTAGATDLNKSVSQARAEAVRDYLVANGASFTSLAVSGEGETEHFGPQQADNRVVTVELAD